MTIVERNGEGIVGQLRSKIERTVRERDAMYTRVRTERQRTALVGTTVEGAYEDMQERVDLVHQLQRRGSEEPDGGDQEHGVARRVCGVPAGPQVFKLLRRVRDQERALRPRTAAGGDDGG